MHVRMTSGFHMLREIKLILKISMISHMSDSIYWGGRGGGKLPPPKKKESFPE